MTDDLIRRGDAIAKIKERASGKSSSGLVLTVDAAIDALAALPRSSSQRSKERAMTDAELIARLRKDDTDFWHCEAADRIEALTAKLATCEKYRDAYDEMGRIGTQAVRDLEAKLAKVVERLTNLEKSASEVSRYGAATGPQWTKMSIDILAARATLAEIKGDEP